MMRAVLRALGWTLSFVVIVFALTAAVVTFGGERIARHALERALDQTLVPEVRVLGAVQWTLGSELALRVTDVEVRAADGHPLIVLEALAVVAPFEALRGGAPRLGELVVTAPRLHFREQDEALLRGSGWAHSSGHESRENATDGGAQFGLPLPVERIRVVHGQARIEQAAGTLDVSGLELDVGPLEAGEPGTLALVARISGVRNGAIAGIVPGKEDAVTDDTPLGAALALRLSAEFALNEHAWPVLEDAVLTFSGDAAGAGRVGGEASVARLQLERDGRVQGEGIVAHAQAQFQLPLPSNVELGQRSALNPGEADVGWALALGHIGFGADGLHVVGLAMAVDLRMPGWVGSADLVAPELNGVMHPPRELRLHGFDVQVDVASAISRERSKPSVIERVRRHEEWRTNNGPGEGGEASRPLKWDNGGLAAYTLQAQGDLALVDTRPDAVSVALRVARARGALPHPADQDRRLFVDFDGEVRGTPHAGRYDGRVAGAFDQSRFSGEWSFAADAQPPLRLDLALDRIDLDAYRGAGAETDGPLVLDAWRDWPVSAEVAIGELRLEGLISRDARLRLNR